MTKKCRIEEVERAKFFFKISKFYKDNVFIKTFDLSYPSDVFAADIFYHTDCLRSSERKYERAVASLNQSQINNSFQDLENDDVDLNDDVTLTKNNAVKTTVNQTITEIRADKAYTLSKISETVKEQFGQEVLNSDIKNYLSTNFKDEIKFSNSTNQSQSTLVYHSSITVEQLIEYIRTQNILKESAELFNFDESKYC